MISRLQLRKAIFRFFSKNPYEILNVDKKSTLKEIKKSYTSLAKKWHPDKNPSPEAKDKFSEIKDAFQILSNEEKRKQIDYEIDFEVEEPYEFDEENKFTGFSYDDFEGHPDMPDHFGTIFRDIDDFFDFDESCYKQEKAVKGTNIKIDLDVTFVQAINGCSKEITFWKRDVCLVCEGKRSKPGTVPIKCKHCECTGTLKTKSKNIVYQTECRRCSGKGYIIKEMCCECAGSGVQMQIFVEIVDIPRGVKNHQEIILYGKGNKGDHGGQRGDIILKINLVDDGYYKVDGLDILIEKDISISDSVLGKKLLVDTLEGEIEVEIPQFTENRDFVLFENKGLKSIHDETVRGDLYISFNVQFPDQFSDDQKDILSKIKILESKTN